jgi:RNA polymerase sigma-70 factor (ECF subfamily)
LLLIARRELGPQLRAKGGASDLVQQSVLDALRDFGRFKGTTEAELLHWLRRLLLNNLADFTRRYRDTDKRRAEREVPIDAGDSSGELDGGLAADWTSPSGEAMAQEQADAVRRALRQLPDDHRHVLLLRYQDGLRFEEIGRTMGLTANAARKLLLRAVQCARRELGKPT